MRLIEHRTMRLMAYRTIQLAAYLDDFGKVHVDILGGIATADSVVMDLRTWPARPNVSHLPEVIGAAEGEHVTLGEVPAKTIMQR